MVVYANRSRWWSLPLEPGTPVYEGQSLFLIPDLSRMEVNVSVHESMGPRVRAGMKAKVRIASQPDRVIGGTVAAIEMLSTPNWKEWDENVRHFLVRVTLDSTPASALPFMSATVEIDTGHVSNALVIPVEALAVADGRKSCYVVTADGLERRPSRLAARLATWSRSPWVSTRESMSYHGRSTSTKRSLATRSMNTTATSRGIDQRPARLPAKQHTFIPPAR